MPPGLVPVGPVSVPDQYPVSVPDRYPDSTVSVRDQHPEALPSVPDQHPEGPPAHPAAGQGAYPGAAGPYPADLPTGTAQNPWAAPDDGERRKRLGLVVAGVLALVVVVGGAFFVWNKISGDGGAQAAAKRQAAIEGAVEDYLKAVAEGDAATALKYLDKEPTSTRMLTDDVLAASNEAAAMTGIEVRAVSSSGQVVEARASYRLGDEDVEQTFAVTERDGTWLVVDGTATVDLSVSTGDLPLAVNGKTVPDPAAVVLFPGSYTLTVAGDPGAHVTLGNATFLVTDSEDVKVPTIAATLTDDGLTAFRQAVRASVEACVASPNLESGCPGSGLDVPAEMGDGTVTTEGTVVRTLSPELSAELDALMPRLSGTNPGRAFAMAPDGLVNLAITGTRAGQAVSGDIVNSQNGKPGFQLGTPEVDMTDPALPVTWSGR